MIRANPASKWGQKGRRLGKRSMIQRIAMLFALLVMTASTLAAGQAKSDNRSAPPLPLDWQATLATDHLLVGRIYDVRNRQFVDADTLARSLALARFPLLGEIHDNPDHHLWQAWAIRAISKLRGARIVEGAPQIDMIAMEMLSVDQYPGIDKFYGRNARVPRKRKASAFGRLVNWEKSGWPDFRIYEPIIAQAQYEQIAVAPASPSREMNMSVSRKGPEEVLGSQEMARIALDQSLPAIRQTELIDEIRDSHCGLMSEDFLPRMAEVQRFRDATMADALLSPGGEKGAILIAGNGHVRKDRGVAWYLERRGVNPADILALGMIEVRPPAAQGEAGPAPAEAANAAEPPSDGQDTPALDTTDPEAYPIRAPDGTPYYDYAVFTPSLERPDPCERMRESFDRIRRQKAADRDES